MGKSNLDQFLKASQGLQVWIGVDTHKKTYAVALYRRDGVASTFSTPSDVESFVARICSWRDSITIRRVVYEAGPCGFNLARALKAAGIKYGVVAPSRVPRPILKSAKTDRLDCLKLPEYAAKGQFPRYIAVPSETEEHLRSLQRHRFHLVDDIRRCKNRIKGLLLMSGIPEPSGLTNWTSRSLSELQSLELNPGLEETLKSTVRRLEWLQHERKGVEARLEVLIKEQGLETRFRFLRSVPGVGPIVAATYLLEVFNLERFEKAEDLTGYLGLAPVVSQSGNGRGKASLRQVGQSRLRSLLIEAAWIFKRKDQAAGAFYNRILSRTGNFAKAICVVARKLAIVMWRVALEGRCYKPSTI